jgi:hypothetical protein
VSHHTAAGAKSGGTLVRRTTGVQAGLAPLGLTADYIALVHRASSTASTFVHRTSFYSACLCFHFQRGLQPALVLHLDYLSKSVPAAHLAECVSWLASRATNQQCRNRSRKPMCDWLIRKEQHALCKEQPWRRFKDVASPGQQSSARRGVLKSANP